VANEPPPFLYLITCSSSQSEKKTLLGDSPRSHPEQPQTQTSPSEPKTKGNSAPSKFKFMNVQQIEQKAGQLATAGIFAGIPRLIKRVNDALKKKGITVAKMVRMYAVIEKAVEDIEAIAKEK
jgi:hypothetical protein